MAGIMGLLRGARARLAGIRKALLDHAYLLTLLAALAVIAASGAYTRSLHASAAEQAAAAAHELAATQPAPSPSPTAAILRPRETLQPIRAGGTAVMPVSGGVLRAYDSQRHVFWAALSCYKPHAALDLAAQPGETVRCAMDGVVVRAVRDELWGWRVEVMHSDGRRAVYAGLLLCCVQEGAAVTRGQALGEVMAQIPCEAEIGTHLHLELHDGKTRCDPALMLPGG